jgi:hypothetical protein
MESAEAINKMMRDLFDEIHDELHQDRRLARILLERAERKEDLVHAFLEGIGEEDLSEDNETADVIPIRNTDDDK